MTGVLYAAVALLAIPVAGLPYAGALRLRGALLIAASWLLGSSLIAFALLLCSLANVPWSRPACALAWCLIVCVGAVLLRLFGASPLLRFPSRPALPRILATLLPVAICAFQVAYVAVQAVRVPLGSFDSWSLWEFKGRRFWLDGGIHAGFLHDQAIVFAHPGYPPLIPLLIAWVYTWTGTPDPALMKPLFPLFYSALLLAFFAALRRRLGALPALLGTAALALVPWITEYAGTGLADVPLAASLIAAAAVYCFARATTDRRPLLAAGLLLGLAICTKRDGLLFCLAALPAVWLIERSWSRLLLVALPALLVGLPWYVYSALTAIPDRDFLPVTPANLSAHIDRLGGIARLFLLNMLALDEWSLVWYVFAIVLLLALPRRRLRAPALLLPIAVPLCLYVISLSLSAWPDYTLHVRTSLDRLILVTTPFALWFVCEQLVPSAAGNAP